MPARKTTDPLSKIIPVLTGPVICDVAARDPSTGKWSLLGVFSSVWAMKFPTKRPMTVYFKLSDAEGRYEIKINFVNADDGVQIATASVEARIDDRLESPDIAVPFASLDFAKVGRYEFQVWVNASFLGSVSIDALTIDKRPK